MELLQTCLANPSDCGATRSRWLRAVPIRRACDSRARREFARTVFAISASLTQEPLCDRSVGVDATVAPERPVAANILDAANVDLSQQHRLLVVRGFRYDLSKRVCDE